MKDNIKLSISTISIIICIIILIFSSFVTAMPGTLLSIFIVSFIFALIPTFLGTKKLRISGIVLLIISVLCLGSEYKNKNAFKLKQKGSDLQTKDLNPLEQHQLLKEKKATEEFLSMLYEKPKTDALELINKKVYIGDRLEKHRYLFSKASEIRYLDSDNCFEFRFDKRNRLDVLEGSWVIIIQVDNSHKVTKIDIHTYRR